MQRRVLCPPFHSKFVNLGIESISIGGVMVNELSQEQLLHLARLGAPQRLQELKEERQAIEALIGGDGSVSSEPSHPRRRRRRGMSAAARKAVSERMKKYWAAQRGGRKK